MRRARWYVYAIRIAGEIVYVGKGSGSRSNVSAKRVGGEAEIVKWFADEDAAYAAEKELIGLYRPPINRTLGRGRAPKAGARRYSIRITDQVAEHYRTLGGGNLTLGIERGAERVAP